MPYAGDNKCNYIKIVNDAPIRKKEVNMEKIYRYDNATIYILNLDNYDREKLKKATEVFFKKVINGGKKNGDSNTSRDF